MNKIEECIKAFEKYQQRLARVLIDGGDGSRVRDVLGRMSFTDFVSGWCAARESIEIELPPVFADDEDPLAFDYYRIKLREYIEGQGLKVKS